MQNYQPGEVLLLSFPFVDAVGSKRRPALVLLDTGDEDIIVARITSQIAPTDFDVELAEWKQAGLLLRSYVRVHKVATLEKRLVERKLGKLTPTDWAKVKAKIQQIWASI
jgi:mRNA interferase MazF